MTDHQDVRATERPTARRSRTRAIATVALVVITAGLLAACGGSDGTDASEASTGAAASPTTVAAEAGEPLRVALVTPGPVSDKGYNAAAVVGLDAAAEKHEIETAVSENVQPGASAAQVIRGYATDGFDVIIGHGEPYQGTIEEIARDFPDTMFFVHAGDLDGAENVASSYLAVEEGAYLEGVIAAHLSKTDKIGFVGFTPISLIVRAMNGMELGAQTVRDSVTVESVFTDNLVDPAVAREATNALIANGAGVIVHMNGGTNTGEIFNAAKEAGLSAMGWPVDQSNAAPDTIATSLTVNYPLLVQDEIERVLNGEFEGGVTTYGLESGVVGIAPISDWVPAEARDAAEDARQGILSGSLTVEVSSEL